MTFIPLTGASSGGSKPSNWTVRERLRNITKALTAGSSLDLRFAEKFFYQNDALYPAMELMATHSRTSRAWYPNWDFKNGSEVGRLVEYGADERRYGDYGALDEGASTNQNPNPRFEGGAAGALNGAGALHTNGAHVNADAMNVAYGTEDGWPYLELSYNGTPPGTMWVTILGAGIASASNGQDWTLSLGMRLVSGSLSNVTEVQPRVRAHSGAGSTIQELSENITPDNLHRRHVISGTFTDANTASAGCLLRIATSGAVDFTLRIYAPQLEQAAAPTSPILPTVGTPAAATRAADVVTGVTTDRASRGWYDTQWDYTNGGECGQLLEFLPGVPRVGPQGLLVEEGTTNQIRNPRFEGGTAGTIGSGGAWPTNMSASASGLSVDLAFGTEAGYEYLEMRFYGTTSGTAVNVWLDGSAIVTAAQNDTFTLSLGVRPVSETGTGRGTLYGQIAAYNSALAIIGGNTAPTDTGVGDGGIRRVFTTQTISQAGTASVRPRFDILGLADSTAYDFTYRIYAPQLEQKAYPTSVVLPEAGSPAAATRAAGAPYMELPAGFDPARGFAFLWEFTPLAASNPTTFGGLGDTFDNTVYAASANGDLYVHIRSAGATVASFNLGQLTTGEQVRLAVSLADNNLIASRSGSASLVDTSGAPPQSIARLKLGGGPWSTTGSAQGASHQSFRLFGAALQQADLEALVA